MAIDSKKSESQFQKLWKDFGGSIPFKTIVFNKAIRFYGEACFSLPYSSIGCVLLCRCCLESLFYTLLTRDTKTWNPIEFAILKYSTKMDGLTTFINACKIKGLDYKLVKLANHVKDRGNYAAHIYQHIDRNDETIQATFGRIPGHTDMRIVENYIMENLEWVSKKEALKVLSETRQVMVGVFKKVL